VRPFLPVNDKIIILEETFKMNNKEKLVVRYNPEPVPKPVGHYSHVTRVSKDADLFVFSGQIGIDSNDHIPLDMNEQVKNTIKNIDTILKTQNLSSSNIIKVNILATEEIDWVYFDSIWDDFFQRDYPSMTISYVSALGLTSLKIEIEVWAAG